MDGQSGFEGHTRAHVVNDAALSDSNPADLLAVDLQVAGPFASLGSLDLSEIARASASAATGITGPKSHTQRNLGQGSRLSHNHRATSGCEFWRPQVKIAQTKKSNRLKAPSVFSTTVMSP